MLTGNAPHVPESLFGSLRTLTAHMGLVTATEVGGPGIQVPCFGAGGLLLLTQCLRQPRVAQAGIRIRRTAPRAAPPSGDGTRLPALRPFVHRFGRHRRLRHRVPARIPAVSRPAHARAVPPLRRHPAAPRPARNPARLGRHLARLRRDILPPYDDHAPRHRARQSAAASISPSTPRLP